MQQVLDLVDEHQDLLTLLVMLLCDRGDELVADLVLPDAVPLPGGIAFDQSGRVVARIDPRPADLDGNHQP